MPGIAPPARLDLVTPRACLVLQALLATRTPPRPLTPTVALTIALLDELEAEELIEVDWRPVGPASGAAPSRLCWRLAADLEAVPDLLQRLAARLNAPSFAPPVQDVCLPLWQSLVEAEATAFHSDALRRQGWDPDWSRDVVLVALHLPAPLSILRWRACVRMAIAAGREVGEAAWPEARREIIFRTLLHHALEPSPETRGLTCAAKPLKTALARELVRLMSLEGSYVSAAPTREFLDPAAAYLRR